VNVVPRGAAIAARALKRSAIEKQMWVRVFMSGILDF
jgi:hypothetical protein